MHPFTGFFSPKRWLELRSEHSHLMPRLTKALAIRSA
jgi:hypothetical protein